jgi:ribosomal protein L33
MRLKTKGYIVSYLEQHNLGCTFEDSVYLGAKVIHKFKCKNCGEYFYNTFDSVVRRSFGYCQICNAAEAKRKYSIQDIKDYVLTHGEGCTCISDYYKNSHTPLMFVCKCGNSFTRDFVTFKSSLKCCPSCSNVIVRDKQNHNLDYILTFVKTIAITSDYISGTYENKYSNLTFKCSECGNLFQRNWGTIRKNNKYLLCTECGTCKFSVAEKEVLGFVESMYTVESNSRKIIPPKEIDIYIPELKVGIEFNGDYWHLQHSLEYHLMKYNMAKEKGIELLFLWEHTYNIEDWQELIKRALKGDVDYKLTLDYTQNYIKENQ